MCCAVALPGFARSPRAERLWASSWCPPHSTAQAAACRFVKESGAGWWSSTADAVSAAPASPSGTCEVGRGRGQRTRERRWRRGCRHVVVPMRLRTLTPPPPHARRAPLAVTTCAPSVPLVTAGSTSPSGACSACASPIFVESASPPGTACAALGALFCPARAPRGSTRDPRGAGGPSGPWGNSSGCQDSA